MAAAEASRGVEESVGAPMPTARLRHRHRIRPHHRDRGPIAAHPVTPQSPPTRPTGSPRKPRSLRPTPSGRHGRRRAPPHPAPDRGPGGLATADDVRPISSGGDGPGGGGPSHRQQRTLHRPGGQGRVTTSRHHVPRGGTWVDSGRTAGSSSPGGRHRRGGAHPPRNERTPARDGCPPVSRGLDAVVGRSGGPGRPVHAPQRRSVRRKVQGRAGRRRCRRRPWESVRSTTPASSQRGGRAARRTRTNVEDPAAVSPSASAPPRRSKPVGTAFEDARADPVCALRRDSVGVSWATARALVRPHRVTVRRWSVDTLGLVHGGTRRST